MCMYKCKESWLIKEKIIRYQTICGKLLDIIKKVEICSLRKKYAPYFVPQLDANFFYKILSYLVLTI